MARQQQEVKITHILDEEQRKKLNIIHEYETTDINPAEIAAMLDGELKKSSDVGAKWHINLYYGRKNPVITLKIDPEKRIVHIAFYGPKRKNFFTYRYFATFYDIESIWFVLYPTGKNKDICTDARFLARMGKDQTAGGFVISSAEGFIVSAHEDHLFECEECNI